MINRDRLVKEFLELTGIDSLSKKERRMADALKARLKAMGYEPWEDDAGKRIGGEAGNIIC
ncbi:MAG: peptidase M20, partial [Clostridiaceae bacterium]|nr:peptidase M20 [Clostridiaceae bacterium]